MFWNWKKEMVTDVINKTIEQFNRDATNKLSSVLGSFRKIEDLQKEITRLEIERDKRVEEFARKEREIEHKIGLERKRQEFEITQSKREATVKVQEENLAADKQRFAGEMDFQRKHLEKEVASLNTLVQEMLKRLPSAEIQIKRSSRG